MMSNSSSLNKWRFGSNMPYGSNSRSICSVSINFNFLDKACLFNVKLFHYKAFCFSLELYWKILLCYVHQFKSQRVTVVHLIFRSLFFFSFCNMPLNKLIQDKILLHKSWNIQCLLKSFMSCMKLHFHEHTLLCSILFSRKQYTILALQCHFYGHMLHQQQKYHSLK